jgi:DNA-binding response OmpR family regulator
MGKILVVDDEPHMRRILASNLKQEGHEILVLLSPSMVSTQSSQTKKWGTVKDWMF